MMQSDSYYYYKEKKEQDIYVLNVNDPEIIDI